MPLNNLNFSIIGQALATSATEIGISLNTTTLEATKGQNISPLEKTLSNCVLGSQIASVGASVAVDQLGAIDLNAMLGDMNPQEMIGTYVDMLKGFYSTVAGSKDMVAEYEIYFSLISVVVNSFAIFLIILTSVGLILGFVNLKCLGGTFICCSCCLSVPCMTLSYVVSLVFMLLTLATSQMCYTLNGITLAP